MQQSLPPPWRPASERHRCPLWRYSQWYQKVQNAIKITRVKSRGGEGFKSPQMREKNNGRKTRGREKLKVWVRTHGQQGEEGLRSAIYQCNWIILDYVFELFWWFRYFIILIILFLIFLLQLNLNITSSASPSMGGKWSIQTFSHNGWDATKDPSSRSS